MRYGRFLASRSAIAVMASEENDGAGDLPGGHPLGRKRIVNAQAAGPDGQEQVLGIRDERVSQAQRKWRHQQIGRVPPCRLRQVSHDHRSRDQAEERQLFANQRHPGFRESSDPIRRLPVEAPERPVIQQEQDEGPRHQHRFRHQSQGQPKRNQRVPPPRRRLGIAGVGQQAQQPEEGRQVVFAFDRPRDRFDVQRMQGEEGRHDCASPAGPGESLEQQEKEQGVRNMDQRVDEQVSTCI